MAQFFDQILEKHQEFIEKQHMFFVATAIKNGSVNLSPKGMDSFKVLDANTVLWLNLTGSGNETAVHVEMNPRMTMMMCSFEKNPLILRLYGKAEVFHRNDEEWQDLMTHFGHFIGARQIFKVKVDKVQTSCGYAVPFYEFISERDTLLRSAEKRGEENFPAYWEKKNSLSIDGHESHILEKNTLS